MMAVYLQLALNKLLVKNQCYPQSLENLQTEKNMNWHINAVVLKLARLSVIQILLYVSPILSSISQQIVLLYSFIM